VLFTDVLTQENMMFNSTPIIKKLESFLQQAKANFVFGSLITQFFNDVIFTFAQGVLYSVANSYVRLLSPCAYVLAGYWLRY
jgi:hypothetical protein